MDARHAERLRAARRVIAALHAQDFRTWLPRGPEHPLLVALPDDQLGDVFERLDDRRNIHLVMSESEALTLISLTKVVTPDDEPSQVDEIPIHVGSEVGMLVDYLRLLGRPVRCRAFRPEYEMELIDAGEPISVPV